MSTFPKTQESADHQVTECNVPKMASVRNLTGRVLERDTTPMVSLPFVNKPAVVVTIDIYSTICFAPSISRVEPGWIKSGEKAVELAIPDLHA